MSEQYSIPGFAPFGEGSSPYIGPYANQSPAPTYPTGIVNDMPAAPAPAESTTTKQQPVTDYTSLLNNISKPKSSGGAGLSSVGAGIGTLIGGPVGGAVGGSLGALGDMALSWYQSSQTQDAQNAYNKQILDLYNKQTAEQKREYDQGYNLQNKQVNQSIENSDVSNAIALRNISFQEKQAQASQMAQALQRIMAFSNTAQSRSAYNNLWGK